MSLVVIVTGFTYNIIILYEPDMLFSFMIDDIRERNLSLVEE